MSSSRKIREHLSVVKRIKTTYRSPDLRVNWFIVGSGATGKEDGGGVDA